MHDNLPVSDLVTRARNGEKQAWDAIVERYAPLIWSICRRHGLPAERYVGRSRSDPARRLKTRARNFLKHERFSMDLPVNPFKRAIHAGEQ